MFENGCFLRRQKRFKCARKEMLRHNRRTSMTGGSHVDRTPPDGRPSADVEVSTTQIENTDDLSKKPEVNGDTKPPKVQFPARATYTTCGRDVSLLQAMASVGDYRMFPLSRSAGDVVQQPGYGGDLAIQRQRFDATNFALFQNHRYPNTVSNPAVAASLEVRNSRPHVGPEVLTAFPVYDALQRRRGDGVIPVKIDATTTRFGDQIHSPTIGNSTHNSSFLKPSYVQFQLQQPPYQYPSASDVNSIANLTTIQTDLSHSTRFGDDQRHPFRFQSTSVSDLSQCDHIQPSAPQSPTGNDVISNLISQTSAASGNLDFYSTFSAFSGAQRP